MFSPSRSPGRRELRGVPRWLSPPCPPDPPPPNSGMLHMDPDPVEAAGMPQVSAPEDIVLEGGKRLLPTLVTMAAEDIAVLEPDEARLLPDCCGFTPSCCKIMDTSLSVAVLAWMVVLPNRHWCSAFCACNGGTDKRMGMRNVLITAEAKSAVLP